MKNIGQPPAPFFEDVKDTGWKSSRSKGRHRDGRTSAGDGCFDAFSRVHILVLLHRYFSRTVRFILFRTTTRNFQNSAGWQVRHTKVLAKLRTSTCSSSSIHISISSFPNFCVSTLAFSGLQKIIFRPANAIILDRNSRAPVSTSKGKLSRFTVSNFEERHSKHQIEVRSTPLIAQN